MPRSVVLNVIAACITALLVAPAQAGGSSSKQETLAAQVYEDGGLILKKGAVKVQGSNGAYSVFFNRNVSRCFYSVTPTTPANFTVSAQALELNKKAVLVEMRRENVQVPGSFYLVVTCFD